MDAAYPASTPILKEQVVSRAFREEKGEYNAVGSNVEGSASNLIVEQRFHHSPKAREGKPDLHLPQGLSEGLPQRADPHPNIGSAELAVETPAELSFSESSRPFPGRQPTTPIISSS